MRFAHVAGVACFLPGEGAAITHRRARAAQPQVGFGGVRDRRDRDRDRFPKDGSFNKWFARCLPCAAFAGCAALTARAKHSLAFSTDQSTLSRTSSAASATSYSARYT